MLRIREQKCTVRGIDVVLGLALGFVCWLVARYRLRGFYTIGPSERAVLASWRRSRLAALGEKDRAFMQMWKRDSTSE